MELAYASKTHTEGWSKCIQHCCTSIVCLNDTLLYILSHSAFKLDIKPNRALKTPETLTTHRVWKFFVPKCEGFLQDWLSDPKCPSLFLESKREIPNASWPIHMSPGFIWSMLQTNLALTKCIDAVLGTNHLQTDMAEVVSPVVSSSHLWQGAVSVPGTARLAVGLVPRTFEALSRSRTVTTPCQSTVHTSSPMQIASEHQRLQMGWHLQNGMKNGTQKMLRCFSIQYGSPKIHCWFSHVFCIIVVHFPFPIQEWNPVTQLMTQHLPICGSEVFVSVEFLGHSKGNPSSLPSAWFQCATSCISNGFAEL